MNNNDNSTTFEGLPSEVVNSAMTPSQLKVMEVLFLYNGLDKTKSDGYFFISNDTLMKEAGIGSKATLIKIIRFFESNGFIERKTGDFTNRKASEYILYEDRIKQWCSNNPKPISRNDKTLQSSDEIREAIKRAVTSAIKPLLDKQREQEGVIKSLQGEIASLRADMRTLIEARCTTDTEIDTQYKKINKSTESTEIRQNAANTIISKHGTNTNPFDIRLIDLKRAVDEFKRTPSWENKKVISGIIERIKALHQQGGCTLKQLRYAYAIQKDINGIPLPRSNSATQAVIIPNASTSVPTSYFSTSSQQVDNTISNRKPTDVDIRNIEALITQSNYFKQPTYNALITQLQRFDDTTKEYYINRYIHSIYPEINEEVIAFKKDAYKRLNLQYPDYTSPDSILRDTFSPSRAGFQIEGLFGL